MLIVRFRIDVTARSEPEDSNLFVVLLIETPPF